MTSPTKHPPEKRGAWDEPEHGGTAARGHSEVKTCGGLYNFVIFQETSWKPLLPKPNNMVSYTHIGNPFENAVI